MLPTHPERIYESATEKIKIVYNNWQYSNGNEWTLTRKNDNSQFWIEFHSYQKGSSPLHVKLEISSESFMAWYSIFPRIKVKTYTAPYGDSELVVKKFLGSLPMTLGDAE